MLKALRGAFFGASGLPSFSIKYLCRSTGRTGLSVRERTAEKIGGPAVHYTLLVCQAGWGHSNMLCPTGA